MHKPVIEIVSTFTRFSLNPDLDQRSRSESALVFHYLLLTNLKFKKKVEKKYIPKHLFNRGFKRIVDGKIGSIA